MSTPAVSDLSAAWRDLAGSSPEAEALGADLLERWAEPHRRYHTPDHLRAVLAAIDELAGLAPDISAVRYAAWFHDAVYAGQPGDDEQRSAQLAEEALPRCGLSAERVTEVARLVRLTATHRPAADDPDGRVLCDADLAVLAGAPREYLAYTTAVREEYAHVGDPEFRRARAAVLRALLEAPQLFHTPIGRARWEDRARVNARAELLRLEKSASGSASPQP
ncbi:putative metal-dependent HD superfamily phosphohydrolase [Lipingzhangella halophila]|uniref:Putative metal-dependent HD superfamily phosphohydrolase n=1 Tax=Lipingzhangella halophila TaxID=1783352 RepID=A0A7W7W321_9ACTN|nr:putative metal-dependent HD superfamily phosphohydrolase [Lipingzhangella halophila]